ncbi:MAG: 30S ribosomal protein S9 [Planctomycetota bacterium]|jgi:small subunit ribosomal protein S9
MAETDTKKPTIDIGSKAEVQEPQPSAQPAKKGPDKGGFWWGTGRRKSSVARVRIKPGEGKMLINKKELSDYFAREQDRQAVIAPLLAVEGLKSFDVFVNVQGGGASGQSGATLQKLRDGGHLTRDSRMVERKKPGQRGARKRFQFSKR